VASINLFPPSLTLGLPCERVFPFPFFHLSLNSCLRTLIIIRSPHKHILISRRSCQGLESRIYTRNHFHSSAPHPLHPDFFIASNQALHQPYLLKPPINPSVLRQITFPNFSTHSNKWLLQTMTCLLWRPRSMVRTEVSLPHCVCQKELRHLLPYSSLLQP
jgi:hypothetical protein